MTDYCVFRAYELNVFNVHVQLYSVYNCTHCKTVLIVKLYSVYDCTHCKTVLSVQLYSVYNCTHCKTVLIVKLYSVYDCTLCTAVRNVLCAIHRLHGYCY